MKVERTEIEQKKEFKPFAITLTFETEQEAFDLHNIFNCAEISNATESFGNDIAFMALRRAIDKNELFDPDWEAFYEKLRSQF